MRMTNDWVFLGAIGTILRLVAILAVGCGSATSGTMLPVTQSPLRLDRVVLYRNGVGYFERRGTVSGNLLTLKVRKDQVNDLLKSLTVVDASSGQALSVSIPLDPTSWQNAALATLSPGAGNLAGILDGLRGTHLSVETGDGRHLSGRIVMVEKKMSKASAQSSQVVLTAPANQDYQLTLLEGDTMGVVALDDIVQLEIHDQDLVMQLHRRLDASAGEGMFQQVELQIRLNSQKRHELLVSYVVAAPLWQPTYRIVLDEDGQALLQSWAVVDNTSGENWSDVLLSLTAGSPIAFQYDLHTPRNVTRPDLSNSGARKQASVALGESVYGQEDEMAQEEMAMEAPQDRAVSGADGVDRQMAPRKAEAKMKRSRAASGPQPGVLEEMMAPSPPSSLSAGALGASVKVDTIARRVAGQTAFDLGKRVTLPDGSASMVALLNEMVTGEQAFLFKPGGAGQGYEVNPYRVVRFTNSTDFVLESGPISIYAGGSFVGEGLSEEVAAGSEVTIPFAVEPAIAVRSTTNSGSTEARLVSVNRGVFEVEQFYRQETEWVVKGMKQKRPYKVLVRHPRAGRDYELVSPTEGVETLDDGYYIPIVVKANRSKARVKVVERTPSRRSISIWDGDAVNIITRYLSGSNVSAKTREALLPLVSLRREIGRLDTEISGLEGQQRELDERAEQTRENLRAIKKDSAAARLRARLNKRLEAFAKEGDALGRRMVTLSSQRLEKKIELEDLLQDFSVEF